MAKQLNHEIWRYDISYASGIYYFVEKKECLETDLYVCLGEFWTGKPWCLQHQSHRFNSQVCSLKACDRIEASAKCINAKNYLAI